MVSVRKSSASLCAAVLLLPVAGVSSPATELAPLSDADFLYDGQPPPAQVELGRLLFYDKVLSGNRNISCATCHHPVHETGDGLPLSVGEGGGGLGVSRTPGNGASAIVMRVGRNAQPLFNLGARQFTTLFHDGRIEADRRNPDRILTPVGDGLPHGLDNILAIQALFPVVAVDEMAGHPGRNEIADAVNVEDVHAAWALLEERIRGIPEYVELFRETYTHIDSAGDIRMADLCNAIAAFTTVEWRADDSRFDAFLRGDASALTPSEHRGFEVFYGNGGCSDCHAGVLQTDFDFHSIAMPQIGPGKGHGFDGREDFGREVVSGNPADRYRFRTPSLRNVTHTGPWGHSGAYDSLEAVVRHHLDPVAAIDRYATMPVIAPARPDLEARDFLVQGNPVRRTVIARSNELPKSALSDDEIADLLAFLDTLTDERSLNTEIGVPERVPSGLPVDD